MTVEPGELHVWRIELDTISGKKLPPPDPEDVARASRFATPELSRRYLNSRGALRHILQGVIGREPHIARMERGKPWLPDTPQWRFNLSHSRGLALVGVAREAEVGVDVEWIRPQPRWEDIAERYFPPSVAAEFFAAPEAARNREFFRCWTRLEAMWKALGEGLNAAGRELDGPWSVQQLELGESLTGAAAARAEGMRVVMHCFGDGE